MKWQFEKPQPPESTLMATGTKLPSASGKDLRLPECLKRTYSLSGYFPAFARKHFGL